jgi:polyhydroxybutyrate depolymerase
MTTIAHKLGRGTTAIFLVLMVLLLARHSFGNSPGSITVDGHERTYEVHVPGAYKGEQAVPLVVVLHGRGGNGPGTAGLTQFDSVADAHGFLLVYPEGLENSWADGRGATSSDKDGIDDIKFLSELIRKLARNYKIDSLRVFVAGYSNGGFMSQRVACELSSQVAAVGVVAATMGEITASRCHPEKPVSVMLIQGTQDPLVPFQGGPMGKDGSHGTILSLQKTAGKWAGLDACNSKPEVSTLEDKAGDGTTIRREAFRGCKEGAEVISYTVEGGGHTWPGGKPYLPESIIGKTSGNMDASEVLWEFFSRHSRS